MTTPDGRVARAYDTNAPEYDAQLEKNLVAAYMRAQLHAHFTRVFRPGDQVLDLTAGTGIDACFLAARGVQVLALDISPGMIAELQKSAARRALHIDARVLPAERLIELEAREFDGVFSTFAGLNTIENLPRLARELIARVKPGGRVILHALNTFCLWEWAAALVRGRLVRARRGEITIGGEIVQHQFYNPFALWRAAFAPYFELRTAYALSVVAAPALVNRLPRAAPAVFALDRIVGRVFPAAGDFFVVELEKRRQ